MSAAASPSTVAEYLEHLPEDRRAMVEAIRRAINRRLPKGYEEGIQYGMIGWFVPHSRHPAGYHCDPRQPVPFAGLGNWKHHVGIHLFCTYVDPAHHEWFRTAWTATGAPLDMGKGCVRVKRLEDVPLDVLAECVRRVPVKTFLERYEAIVPSSGRRASKTAKSTKKSPARATTTSPAKKIASGRASGRSAGAARGRTGTGAGVRRRTSKK
ncbi:MAG: DUF1801 domain-containing protein [Phycisphaerales bacterium]|jgi:hypothetical protein